MLCENLKIETCSERIAVFSNKKSGCYFTQTCNKNSDYWRGWFVNDDKIIDDYSILTESGYLDKSETFSEIYPHKIIKKSQNIFVEEIFPDYSDSLILTLNNKTKSISFIPLIAGERKISGIEIKKNAVIFAFDEFKFLTLTIGKSSGIEIIDNHIPDLSYNKYHTPVKINFDYGEHTVVLSYASNKEDSLNKGIEIFKNKFEIIEQKINRINGILKYADINVSDKIYEFSLNWILVQTDNLIMEKVGKGIYAGYPWFNNYWGRDTFISFPGATLVTGKFEDAKQILTSFFDFQNNDKNSEFYGRVPNRVNNENDIIYNTADGTPWSVIQLYNYVKYTGDIELLEKLYEKVRLSIESNIVRADEKFFLKHKDAETWMDAQINGKIPITPRGNRANDIQVLWFNQLKYGIIISEILEKKNTAEKWKSILETLKKNFRGFFINSSGTLFDHLNQDGSADMQIRPNQIFAVSLGLDDLIEFETGKRILDEVVFKLTYSYGVGSLNQDDPDFKPFHHSPDYHFDLAYHNGIVWQWLAGHLITSLVKFGKTDTAFGLTKNMADQSMNKGAAGCIAELIDAFPDKNGNIKLSGAFSQAWSNAEFLRNFYSDYCGFNPDMINNTLYLSPFLPEEINFVSFVGYFGGNAVKITFEKNGELLNCQISPVKTGFLQKIKIIFYNSDEREIYLKNENRFLIDLNLKRIIEKN
ncbi:hypothetical protein KA977_08790 [Candidatus Dependentiae bacterium]|nr:hypothetical protein [Candidatus Dependentiae bacterium]